MDFIHKPCAVMAMNSDGTSMELEDLPAAALAGCPLDLEHIVCRPRLNVERARAMVHHGIIPPAELMPDTTFEANGFERVWSLMKGCKGFLYTRSESLSEGRTGQ